MENWNKDKLYENDMHMKEVNAGTMVDKNEWKEKTYSQ